MSDNVTRRLLTRRDVQDLLSISSSTIYAWLKDGRLPEPVMIGPNSPRWDAAALDEWLEAKKGG